MCCRRRKEKKREASTKISEIKAAASSHKQE
jgi:hypothetical protein